MRGNTSKKIARNIRGFEQMKSAFFTETGNPAHGKPKKKVNTLAENN